MQKLASYSMIALLTFTTWASAQQVIQPVPDQPKEVVPSFGDTPLAQTAAGYTVRITDARWLKISEIPGVFVIGRTSPDPEKQLEITYEVASPTAGELPNTGPVTNQVAAMRVVNKWGDYREGRLSYRRAHSTATFTQVNPLWEPLRLEVDLLDPEAPAEVKNAVRTGKTERKWLHTLHFPLKPANIANPTVTAPVAPLAVAKAGDVQVELESLYPRQTAHYHARFWLKDLRPEPPAGHEWVLTYVGMRDENGNPYFGYEPRQGYPLITNKTRGLDLYAYDPYRHQIYWKPDGNPAPSREWGREVSIGNAQADEPTAPLTMVVRVQEVQRVPECGAEFSFPVPKPGETLQPEQTVTLLYGDKLVLHKVFYFNAEHPLQEPLPANNPPKFPYHSQTASGLAVVLEHLPTEAHATKSIEASKAANKLAPPTPDGWLAEIQGTQPTVETATPLEPYLYRLSAVDSNGRAVKPFLLDVRNKKFSEYRFDVLQGPQVESTTIGGRLWSMMLEAPALDAQSITLRVLVAQVVPTGRVELVTFPNLKIPPPAATPATPGPGSTIRF
jgi:hypothetical protein